MRVPGKAPPFVTILLATASASIAEACGASGWTSMLTVRIIQAVALAALLSTLWPTARREDLASSESASMRRRLIAAMIAVCGLTLVAAILNQCQAMGVTSFGENVAFAMNVAERCLAITWLGIPFAFLQLHPQTLTSSTAPQITGAHSNDQTLPQNQISATHNGRTIMGDEITDQDGKKNHGHTPGQRESAGTNDLQKERLGAIGQISAGISHSLNNALMPITSYCNLLLNESQLSERQTLWLSRIAQAANDATVVVENLQQFHTNRTGEGFGPVAPAKIIQQAIDATRRIWPQDQERRLRIESTLSSDKNIDAEPDQIYLLVTNLILNAVESIDKDKEGLVSITVSEESGTLSISVRDNGKGMSPQDVKCCFEPFYTTKHDRAGLGLSVAHGVARRHGGTFDVETNNYGTTICVRFPASKTATARQVEEEPTEEEQEFHGMQILLVEDDDTVRVAMTDILETIGASVTGAGSGPEALEFLSTSSFNIMITDLGLPEMNGVELIEKTREICDVPIVLMSGWPKARVVKQLEGKPQPNAILPKPARFKEVVRVIHDHARSETRQSSGTGI